MTLKRQSHRGTDSAEAPDSMTRCMKVLVATASSNLQKLICRMLQRSGYSTDEVTSAAAALEAVRNSDYEAIVTDMHLPDCCGATLVNSMREAGVDTLLDIRRHPASRHHPQFGKRSLATALTAASTPCSDTLSSCNLSGSTST